MITVTRHRRSRFWAVWKDGELIVVAVYRKGAESVARLVREIEGQP